jgi:hypothetical protein
MEQYSDYKSARARVGIQGGEWVDGDEEEDRIKVNGKWTMIRGPLTH